MGKTIESIGRLMLNQQVVTPATLLHRIPPDLQMFHKISNISFSLFFSSCFLIGHFYFKNLRPKRLFAAYKLSTLRSHNVHAGCALVVADFLNAAVRIRSGSRMRGESASGRASFSPKPKPVGQAGGIGCGGGGGEITMTIRMTRAGISCCDIQLCCSCRRYYTPPLY